MLSALLPELHVYVCMCMYTCVCVRERERERRGERGGGGGTRSGTRNSIRMVSMRLSTLHTPTAYNIQHTIHQQHQQHAHGGERRKAKGERRKPHPTPSSVFSSYLDLLVSYIRLRLRKLPPDQTHVLPRKRVLPPYVAIQSFLKLVRVKSCMCLYVSVCVCCIRPHTLIYARRVDCLSL